MGRSTGFIEPCYPCSAPCQKKYKADWKIHVNKVVLAYNCTKQESTGYSPFFLLFGRSQRLPIDIVFGKTISSDDSSQRAYVQKWTECMQEAKIVNQNANKAALKGRQYHDHGLSSVVLNPGDHVLVRNLTGRGGPGKLSSSWAFMWLSGEWVNIHPYIR